MRELVMLHIGDLSLGEDQSIVRAAYINKAADALIKARDVGCARVECTWRDLCADGPTIPVELGDRLETAGFLAASLPFTTAPRTLELVESEDRRALHMTPLLFLDLFVFVCRLGDPALTIEVPEPFYIALGGAGLIEDTYLEAEVEVPDDENED